MKKGEDIKVAVVEEDMQLEKQVPLPAVTSDALILRIRETIAELLNKSIENIPSQEIKQLLFLAYWWLKYSNKGFNDELYKAYYKSLRQEAMLISAIEQLLARRESFYFLYSTYVTTTIVDTSKSEPLIGTTIDYRTVKVDIIFTASEEEGRGGGRRGEEEAVIRIIVSLLKDYQGPNVGRLLT
ncbi:MAG: hypothetical protein QW416_09085 [Candidatus Nitrosocaldaceae archaeon]